LSWFGCIHNYIQGDGKGAAAPPLGGIVGRKAGETLFGYSKAMKGSGIVWSEKHIFMYLLNPGKHIPGNKMSFSGLAGT
jgi:cytochrome c